MNDKAKQRFAALVRQGLDRGDFTPEDVGTYTELRRHLTPSQIIRRANARLKFGTARMQKMVEEGFDFDQFKEWIP